MDDFFERLKKRKLVQWSLAYVAGAFALIQVLDIVGQRFGWPDVVVRTTILVLAIGFVLVLVLAWYHGEQGTQRVTGIELLILALVLAIGSAILWSLARTTTAAAPVSASNSSARPAKEAITVPTKSIAVLPFTDLSPAHDQEYFSDGMAEEILNALAKVKDLKVAGRTSSFSFKGKNEDLRNIGKALSVANVLEGSVRKQGDKVRITAQLIEAESGYHLWSESYDGDLTDVFELQERIARAIAGQLNAMLSGDQQQRLVPVLTANPEAYALYLQATGIFNRREGARFPQAIAELEQSIALDPKFARAHSRLAAIHSLEPIYNPSDSDRALAAAEREAALASELDPTLAEPYAALGISYGQTSRNNESRAAFERALAMDPHDLTANFWAGVALINTGYTASGNAAFDRVLALDPLMPNALLWRGIQYYYAGDLAHAEVMLRRAADVGLAHSGVGMRLILAARGDKAAAAKQLAEGLRALGAGMPASAPDVIATGVYGDGVARAKAIAMIDDYLATKPIFVSGVVPYSLLLLGEEQRALAIAAERRTTNDAIYLHVLWSPAERKSRSTPEFQAVLKRLGLVALWNRYGTPDACRLQTSDVYACD